MAHRIQNNMLAYKGETPWHGLGVAVSHEMTGAEMLIAAGMDWKVQRRALAMRDSMGKGLITDPLKRFVAIVRQDTNQVFQVATSKYFPLQNAEMVEFFRQYCEAGHASIETIGAIDGGGKIFCLAKLNGGSSAMIGAGDEVKGYMLLASSHDGSLRVIGKATQIRVVCWNTLSAALGKRDARGQFSGKVAGEFRMKHTRKWNQTVALEAQRVMGMATQEVIETNNLSKKLAQVAIDGQGRLEFIRRLIGGESILEQVVADSTSSGLLDSVVAQSQAQTEGGEDLKQLGKGILEAILSSPGSHLPSAKDTMWGAVNGVTYYVDHVRGRSQDSRLSAAWFGDGDRLKRSAVRVAVDMAGVTGGVEVGA